MDYHDRQDKKKDKEKAVIDALMSMFSQYCSTTLTTSDGRPMFDHECMSAGEAAADVLLAHKKISIDQLVRP